MEQEHPTKQSCNTTAPITQETQWSKYSTYLHHPRDVKVEVPFITHAKTF